MTVSEEQRNAITTWLNEGASLADVQHKLKDEFDIVMTYMDVRLLVIDIGAEVQDKPEPKPKKKTPAPTTESGATDREELNTRSGQIDEADPGMSESSSEQIGGKVAVSVDRLVVPGAMVSGNVTFSDGVNARWMIDRMGRFGLEPDVDGYQPADDDMQQFQLELRDQLQRMGYA
jgi:hypothetical protein